MKNILFFILLFILAIPFSTALTDYNITGTPSFDYALGRGIFSTVDTPNQAFVTAGDTKNTPLVTDLDHDGTNEILIIDNDEIEMYRTKDLTFIDSIDLGSNTQWSNMVAHNLDGGNDTELILAGDDDGIVYIVKLNSTTDELFLFNSYSILSEIPGHTSGDEGMIGCRGFEDCVLTSSRESGTSSNTGDIGFSIAKLNSSSLGGSFSPVTVRPTGGVHSAYCMPKIRGIQAIDCDSDGDKDYAWSYALVRESGTTGVAAVCNSLVDASTFAIVKEIFESEDIFDTDAGAFSCDENFGRHLAPLLMADISNDAGNEWILGFNTDTDEFKMQVYDEGGSKINDHPEVLRAEGQIISNVFLGNYRTDTADGDDYCVVGFQGSSLAPLSNNVIDVLCGQTRGGTFGQPETREYVQSDITQFNVTQDYERYDIVSHSVQHSSTLTGVTDLDEVLTAYGVHEIDEDSCVLGLCTMDLIFDHGLGSGVLISVNPDFDGLATGGTGAEDLILMKPTNLIYLDDGIGNKPAFITDVSFNPCPVNTVMRINETMDINVIVEDTNDVEFGVDTVISEVIWYQGTPNEFVSTSGNVTSGSIVNHNIPSLNQTIVGGTIQINGRDSTEPPEDIDTREFTFTVSANGIQFNDATCDLVFDISAEEEEEVPATIVDTINTVPEEENAVVTSMTELVEITNVGATAIWIIIMIAIGLGVWLFGPEESMAHSFGIVIILEIMMLILGVLFGFIGIGIIIIIVLIGLIALAAFLTRLFTASGGGFSRG